MTFSTSLLNDITMIQSAFNLWNTSTVDITSVPSVKWSMTLQPINRAIASKSYPVSGNSLGLPLDIPSGALVLLSLSTTWNDSSHSARVEASARKLRNSIISTFKAARTFNRYIDLNHADSHQDLIVGYGPAVWAHLNEVSKEYDPNGIFQNSVPGGIQITTGHLRGVAYPR